MLRGGLVGCGYISHQQLVAWRDVNGAEIVAVCDRERPKAEVRAAEFAVSAVYDDAAAMLSNEHLDFVDIATGPASHLPLTTLAAERKLPVLCQKPMAETLEAAEAMIDVCRRAGVTLMINENGRHQAWFRHLKTLIEDGRLGTVHDAMFFGRWRSTLPQPQFNGQDYFRDMPRLLVYEMGVHYLDIARYLFGEAQSLVAHVDRVSPHIAGDDRALLLLKCHSTSVLINSNWYAVPQPAVQEPVTWGTLHVEGTLATARLHEDGTLALYDGRREIRRQFAADTVARSFMATQQHFVDCLRQGTEPETSGRETLETMRLVFAAYDSSAAGRVISL